MSRRGSRRRLPVFHGKVPTSKTGRPQPGSKRVTDMIRRELWHVFEDPAECWELVHQTVAP